MPITFHFDLKKAIAAMVYLLERLGETDKAKLMKLLYLADRDSFLRIGHPITGDRQSAMPFGPVPSGCLDAINGNAFRSIGEVFRVIHVADAKVSLKLEKKADDVLADDEKRILDDIVRKYGSIPTWKLVRQTHELPEYKEVFIPETSTTIPYETILKHYGDDSQYRKKRPVISAAMAAHMIYPFYGEDADL